eukprot:305798_1
MDTSLIQILFKTNSLSEQSEQKYTIYSDIIGAIFPNVKQFKNQHNEWISIPSLDTFSLQQIAEIKKTLIEQSVIEQIDEYLAIYYTSKKIDYFDEDTIGKFRFYCEDNGFDSDIVKEQMNNVQQCMDILLEMDSKFPFEFGINENDTMQKNKYIFDTIIKFTNGTSNWKHIDVIENNTHEIEMKTVSSLTANEYISETKRDRINAAKISEKKQNNNKTTPIPSNSSLSNSYQQRSKEIQNIHNKLDVSNNGELNRFKAIKFLQELMNVNMKNAANILTGLDSKKTGKFTKDMLISWAYAKSRNKHSMNNSNMPKKSPPLTRISTDPDMSYPDLNKYSTMPTKGPSLTRVSTDPDMSKHRIISIPSLMQTNSNLIQIEHAELSPAPPPVPIYMPLGNTQTHIKQIYGNNNKNVNISFNNNNSNNY